MYGGFAVALFTFTAVVRRSRWNSETGNPDSDTIPLRKHRKWMADSRASYWIYIMHLPVVKFLTACLVTGALGHRDGYRYLVV